jgi:RNA polymerase I-specific transcription initiation factor RRN7
MFSSGTDEEATESDDNHSRYSVSGKKAKDTPRIIDTLALCYLGALTLRLPITTGDIYEWTTNGGLVYARAKDCLPPAMRERLPPKFLSLSLEPPTILQQKRLQRAILDLVDSYEHHHGMTFPAINHPLLLYRYMRQLAFPLEIYGAVVKLARLLRYDFAYAPIGSQKRLRIDDIPDAQLISLVVVCVKLFYPFDNIERHPHAPGEPAGSKMDWEAWNKSAATFKRSIAVPAQLMTQELMVLQEKDIFSLKESEIDQYLDWYQQNWADETIREQDKGSNFREELFKQFPVDPLNETMGSRTPNMDDSAVHTALTKRVEDVHKAMSADKAVGGENAINDIKRPGSQYKHYRRERELPEQARSFYEEAAKASGLSLKMLVEAVFFTEQKIRGWGELQRRRQRMQTEE